jgi:cytochrome c oxidase assembly factor CtaG
MTANPAMASHETHRLISFKIFVSAFMLYTLILEIFAQLKREEQSL